MKKITLSTKKFFLTYKETTMQLGYIPSNVSASEDFVRVTYAQFITLLNSPNRETQIPANQEYCINDFRTRHSLNGLIHNAIKAISNPEWATIIPDINEGDPEPLVVKFPSGMWECGIPLLLEARSLTYPNDIIRWTPDTSVSFSSVDGVVCTDSAHTYGRITYRKDTLQRRDE
jgi:hypothetical protein